MRWPGIIGLGEMMNFTGVDAGDGKMLREIVETHAAHKTVGGHYASPDLGLPFHGYVAGGAEDDHEGTRLEDAVERARQGMKPMLRYGSAWHDVASQVGAITERHLIPAISSCARMTPMHKPWHRTATWIACIGTRSQRDCQP